MASTLVVLVGTSLARAHAPPEATGLYWSESNSSSSTGARTFVRTNRGLLVISAEGSATPSLLCNDAWQASLSEIAPVLATTDAILVGSYAAGLLAAAPDLCGFSRRELALGERHLLDLARSGDTLFALSSATETAGGVLFASTDGGVSWRARASSLGFGTALGLAPSRPQRLYVSQQEIAADEQLLNELAVSDDGGETFLLRSIPLHSDEVRPFLVGVDPLDPGRVFVRTLAADPELPERLLMSEDSGQSFREVASAIGPLAFAISTEHAWLGTRDGLRRSSDRGTSFQALSTEPSHVGCVVQHANDLYVCGFSNQEFGVFRTRDAGESFASYLRFSEVTGGVNCAADSAVTQACLASVADWQEEQAPPEPSSAGQAGAGGGSDRSARQPAGAPRPADSSCQLRRRADGSDSRWSLLLVLLAAFGRRQLKHRTP